MQFTFGLCDILFTYKLQSFQNSLFTSFVATGVPTTSTTDTVKWEPVSRSAPFKCLNIAEQLSVIDLPQAKRVQFWESIYDFVQQ